MQRDQHQILEGIKEHGDVEIYPRSQVRYLIEGIKITQFVKTYGAIGRSVDVKNVVNN